jgi:hypothetical protein
MTVRFLCLSDQEHRDLAREAVRKSVVLLKNGEPKEGKQMLLPLDRKAPKILVAGSHGDDIGKQCGGWTMSWQGSSGNITVGVSLLEAVRSTVMMRPPSSSRVVYYDDEALPDIASLKASFFSYGIVAIGELPYADSYGDSRNLTIPEQSIATVERVCTAMRCVLVLMVGRPLVLEPRLLRMVDAVVVAWFPGTEANGITDVLFGDYPFTAKLSRTWFRSIDQLPMNVGDPDYDPLFPYGFGLTIPDPGGDVA